MLLPCYRPKAVLFNQSEANLYLGVLFFSICAMLFNNWAEFAIITQRLPVFYKQVNVHTHGKIVEPTHQ